MASDGSTGAQPGYMDLMKYAPVDTTQTGAVAPSVSGSAAPTAAPTAVPQGRPVTGTAAPDVPDDSTAYGGLMKYAPKSEPGSDSQSSFIDPETIGGATDSPLSIADRAALSLGNPAGQAAYLKERFPGSITQDTDGKLLVSDGKKWFRADESSDAWDLTKKLAQGAIKGNPLFIVPRKLANAVGLPVDAPSMSDLPNSLHATASAAAAAMGGALPVAGMTLGGIAGAASGLGTAGTTSVPGAMAGSAAGGATGEGIRTSLGRIVGTYQATPTEQLKDVGWEGLLGAGGEVLGIAARPVVGVLKNALKTVSEYGSAYAKSALSSTFGHLTGAGEWAVRRAIDEPDAVTGALEGVVKNYPMNVAPEVITSDLAARQNTLVRSMAEQSKAALQRQYATSKAAVIDAVPSSFTADTGTLIREVQGDMEKAGLGRFAPKGGGTESSSVVPIGQAFGHSSSQAAGKMEFRPFTTAEIAERLNTTPDQLPKILGENSTAAIRQISKLMDQWADTPNVSGARGAAFLMDLKHALSETFSDLASPESPDAIKRLVYQLKDSVNEKIGQRFANVSDEAGQAYVKMNAQYAASKDAVDLFNDAVSKGNVDALVKKLVKDGKTGAYRSLRDEASTMAGLLGQRGNQLMQQVFDLEAAKGFTAFTSKGSAGNSAGQVARWTAGVAQQANPRAVLKELAYGSKAVDFLKGLPRPHVLQLLSDPQAMRAFLGSTMQAFHGESQIKDQLMGAAGQHLQSSALPPLQSTAGGSQ